MNELKDKMERTHFLQQSIITELPLNECSKILFNVDFGKTTPPVLAKLIYDYVKKNGLKDKFLFRVDDRLAQAMNLSEKQIEQINCACSTADPGCMSIYNYMTFAMNCFENLGRREGF